MKKLIYVLLISFVASMSITACTEEEVVPTENGGGIGADPK